MKNIVFLAAAGLAALSLPAPAAAQRQSDQGEARKEMNAGRTMSLREIEARILPMMGDAEYIGPAYDSVALAYRLKFIRDGRVLFVDVDARNGRILRRTR